MEIVAGFIVRWAFKYLVNKTIQGLAVEIIQQAVERKPMPAPDTWSKAAFTG